MARRRLARSFRWGLAAVLAVAGAGTAVAVVVARTAAGREFAVQWALERLEARLDGTIHVGSVGQGGLWGGATLHRVEIADGEGRPVATVDSIRARYSLRDVLGDAPAVADLRLWSPVVVREPGPDGRSRLAAVFAPLSAPGGDALPSDDAGRGFEPGLVVRGARIHDGALVLRNADGAERRLDGIQAKLAFVELAPSPGVAFAAEVDTLTGSYLLKGGRLRLAAAEASVEGTAQEVALVAERLRLPNSVAAGRATARRNEDGRWSLELEVERARSALADFAWLDPVGERLEGGLAKGVATGAWRLEAGPGGLALDAVDGAVEWDGSRVALSGGVAWANTASGAASASRAPPPPPAAPSPGPNSASGAASASGAESFRFRRLRVFGASVDAREAARRLSPTAAARLRATGAQTVSGDVELDGPLDSLHLTGGLVLHGPGGDTLVAASGAGTALGSLRSVRNFAVDATVADFRLARALHPRFPWTGPGRATVQATGDLPTGMTVRAAATRSAAPFPALPPPASAPADRLLDSVSFAGVLYGADGVAVVEGEATAAPLALSGLEPLWPGVSRLDASRFGAVRGTAAVSGPLERLRVAAELATPAGPLVAEGQVSLRSPAVDYDLALSAREFRLSELAPGLPAPTVVSGTASLVGSGTSLASLRGALAVATGPSTVGPVQADTLDARVRIGEDGLLHVESIFARAGGLDLRSDGGTLALGPDAAGSAQGVVVDVSSASIRPLRPLFMGKDRVAWDDLSAIEQGFLIETAGVDPDTFPAARDVRFEGSVQGELRLEGEIADLTATLSATAKGVRYGAHSAGELTMEGEAQGLRVAPPDAAVQTAAPPLVLSGAIEATDSVVVAGRRFAAARVEGSYSLDGSGRAQVRVVRSPGESYEALASVRVDGEQRRVDLDRLVLDFGELRWNLQGPARFAWSPDAVTVRDFGLVRPGWGGLRLRAGGRLALSGGESDFGLEATGLNLALVGRLLQVDQVVEGTAQADVRVHGTADAPRWDGFAQIVGAAWGDLRFDSVSAEARYARRAADVRAGSWIGGRRALAVTGELPLDLRFAAEERLPDDPMDLEIEADAFPLALALGAVDGLEDASGSIGGSLRLQGTRAAPSPSGRLGIEDGTALVAPLGVRLSAAAVEMRVSPDGKVRVNGSVESGGSVQVRGVVDAARPLDPGFDLAFWPRGLQVVNRRDMEAAVTGDSVALTGSYTAPLVEGTLEVDGGTVYLEEFQRSAETLSFYDRSLFEAATEGADRAALAVAPNPFLANLRVLVELEVGRGNWLRSQAMNMETEGDLTVTFDRQRNELILYGAMDVVRGAYTGLPRPFAMTEGEFDFPGTPGFDPNVSVAAESRLRTLDGQPMVVTADISGPLRSLRLALSSDAGPGVTEGDIYSYLLTGRPASAGQAQVDAGVNLVVGRVANQIGALLAPQLRLDHLSVSQAEQSPAAATIGASSLQVEFGRYVRENVFLKGVYQRGYCADPALPVNSGGARAEVGLPQDVTLEGFFENRCTREGFRGLGGLSLDQAWVWGLFFFREWGY